MLARGPVRGGDDRMSRGLGPYPLSWNVIQITILV
jgi:hypothetical protein